MNGRKEDILSTSKGFYRNRVDDFLIDRLKRTSDFDMGESHYHPYYELYYLISGQCRMFVNHTIYYLFPGDILLIPPSVLHKTIYDTSYPAERITVSFTDSFVKELKDSCGADAFSQIFSRPKITIATASQASVMASFGKMLAESVSTDAYSAIYRKAELYQLLIRLGRYHNPSAVEQVLDQAASSMQDAARYIFEHYGEPLTLNDMADFSHMSTTYFSKLFKETTGFGFKEYLNQIRLQNAAQLLEESEDSITSIAAICGFSDGNYFGDAFRKAFGCSPRTYRKRHICQVVE